MSDTYVLTPAARKLLGQLKRCADHGHAFITHAHYGRYALVVPSLRWGNPLVRLDAYNWPTIRALEDAGLVTVGEDWQQELPPFEDRQRGDSTGGYTVTLTEAGKAGAA